MKKELRAEDWQPQASRAQAERDAALLRARGMGWVSIVEAAYPPALRETHDPPAVLFYRGALPDPGQPLAGIVGTRHPGAAALSWAFDASCGLSRAGVNTVSGLALGIDSAAHRGCLAGADAKRGGGRTVAVLGCGIDMVYPASNASLARRIVEAGGVLLAEYPPGTHPAKWTFPERNRIIAGLARALLVVEAPTRSGALISARMALEENRDVWVAAAPQSEESGPSAGQSVPAVFGEGCRRLVEEGASLAYSAASLLADWGLPPPPPPPAVPDSLAASLAQELGIHFKSPS